MTLRVYTDSNVRPEPWMVDAKCANTDPDIFFAEPGDWRATQAAIEVCNRCDVVAQCLEWSLRTNQRDGVSGGMGSDARRRLRSRKKRAA